MDKIDSTILLWGIPIISAIYAIGINVKVIFKHRNIYSCILSVFTIALLIFFIRLEFDEINRKVFELSIYSGIQYFDKWKAYDFLIIIYIVISTKLIDYSFKRHISNNHKNIFVEAVLQSDKKFMAFLMFLSFMLLLIIIVSPIGANFNNFIYNISEMIKHSGK